MYYEDCPRCASMERQWDDAEDRLQNKIDRLRETNQRMLHAGNTMFRLLGQQDGCPTDAAAEAMAAWQEAVGT